MSKFNKLVGYLIIGVFLLDIVFLNLNDIVRFNLGNIFFIIFLLYVLGSIFFGIFLKIKGKNISINSKYILNFILLTIFFILPGLLIYKQFLFVHSQEENLYLRATGRLAMFYFSLALMVSPILQFVKNPNIKLNLILSRKVIGILAGLFTIKHIFEYFSMEYFFYENYSNASSYFSYVLNNFLTRYDALTGIIPGILMIILLITSNKFSMKLLGRYWKKVQWLVFPTYIFVAIHIAFAGRLDAFYILLILLVVGLRLLAYLHRK